MNQPAEWPEHAEEIVTAEIVADALSGMAERLKRRLEPGPLRVVAVMNGGMYPAVELTRRLERPHTLDYVHATRYRGGTAGGEIEWIRAPREDLAGQDVLLVDDIFDEGYTLAAIRERVSGARRVLTAVLALKLHDRGLPRDWVDEHAIEVPDRYVFGCGMDYLGNWRHLDSIWALPEESRKS